ncbi:MAG: hypothetical protein COA63_014155 [Methylophaga sp.]|nr:hypothetical protein [Methylophaga sp.]
MYPNTNGFQPIIPQNQISENMLQGLDSNQSQLHDMDFGYGMDQYGGNQPQQQGGTNYFGQNGSGGGGGLNLSGLQAISSMIGTIGGLFNSFQANKLAKETFQFKKDAYGTNLKNSTQQYNTTLEDRIRSRYVTEGRASGEADQYLKNHNL